MPSRKPRSAPAKPDFEVLIEAGKGEWIWSPRKAFVYEEEFGEHEDPGLQMPFGKDMTLRLAEGGMQFITQAGLFLQGLEEVWADWAQPGMTSGNRKELRLLGEEKTCPAEGRSVDDFRKLSLYISKAFWTACLLSSLPCILEHFQRPWAAHAQRADFSDNLETVF